MSLKAVLFDLDGTLLPMDVEQFLELYFGGISAHMAKYGYEPKRLIESIKRGVTAISGNDGSKTNEGAFWESFSAEYGEGVLEDKARIDEFYESDFYKVKASCRHDVRAENTVRKIKSMGLRVILATNPIFPAVATHNRLSWTGLAHTEFEMCTTYENSRFAKPCIGYYENIAKELGLLPEECLMVGNDVSDDMPARRLGMKVFLLTDNLINKRNEDISQYPNGSFEELLSYVELLSQN